MEPVNPRHSPSTLRSNGKYDTDEYDTDSENELPVEEDDDDDSLTFRRTVTTRSGRTVRVKFYKMGLT